MSRLIVKNLPNNVTADRLRSHFGIKGEVTDVQLKYTSTGVFRHFGFVGFKNESDGEEARNYFDQTFIGACKISVEPSTGPSDPEKPRAWSKYAADSSAFQKLAQKKEGKEEGDEDKKKKKKSKKKHIEEEELEEKYKDDSQFSEFLQVHLKSSRNIWGNDIVLEKEEKEKISEEGGDEKKKKKKGREKEEVEEAEVTEEDAKEAMKKGLSDLEYLKSKMPKKVMEDSTEDATEEKIDSKKKKEKKKKAWKQFYTVKLRDLPLRIKKKDLKELFSPLKPASIRRPGSVKGIAYVAFTSEKDQKRALSKNRSFVRGKQVQVLPYTSTASPPNMGGSGTGHREDDEETRRKNLELVADTGRIFLRNLTFSVTEDDLTKLFQRYGPLAEVNVPIDRHTRLCKGFAFITYVMPEHAVKAYTELDGNVYQGRLLHLIPGQAKKNLEELMEDENLTFKDKKRLQQKVLAKSSHNWNALFLGTNAVADVMAQRYNTSKQEVLNPEGKHSVAVRLALGETQLVAETKKFLEESGVRLEAFSGADKDQKGAKKVGRSKTVLLVKDLPAGTTSEELKELFEKHGVVDRVLLPPHGISALVEFQDPSEARTAFQKLAYTKFYYLPLYLEWAPVDVFQEVGTTSARPPKKENQKETKEEEQEEKEEKLDEGAHKPSEKLSAPEEEVVQEEVVPAEPDTMLFVKNLSFSTSDESLYNHFSSCGKLVSATIATKRNTKQPGGRLLSMGYAFVQYQLKADAKQAMKELQKSELDGHELEIKLSNRDSQAKGAKGVTQQGGDQTGTKILVRNVPFQATSKEVEELFRTFGQLKAVRLPLKMVGSGEHRGFAFVDYHSKSEAKRAMEAMRLSTHLYGRRLVLEWASAEEEGIDRLRDKAAKQSESGPPNKRRKVKDMFGDILGKDM